MTNEEIEVFIEKKKQLRRAFMLVVVFFSLLLLLAPQDFFRPSYVYGKDALWGGVCLGEF